MKKRYYTISEVAELLGVTPQTLRNWEKEGLLISKRTLKGHRRYLKEEIDRFINQKYKRRE